MDSTYEFNSPSFVPGRNLAFERKLQNRYLNKALHVDNEPSEARKRRDIFGSVSASHSGIPSGRNIQEKNEGIPPALNQGNNSDDYRPDLREFPLSTQNRAAQNRPQEVIKPTIFDQKQTINPSVYNQDHNSYSSRQPQNIQPLQLAQYGNNMQSQPRYSPNNNMGYNQPVPGMRSNMGNPPNARSVQDLRLSAQPSYEYNYARNRNAPNANHFNILNNQVKAYPSNRNPLVPY